jgi:hypothetical protein
MSQPEAVDKAHTLPRISSSCSWSSPSIILGMTNAIPPMNSIISTIGFLSMSSGEKPCKVHAKIRTHVMIAKLHIAPNRLSSIAAVPIIEGVYTSRFWKYSAAMTGRILSGYSMFGEATIESQLA